MTGFAEEARTLLTEARRQGRPLVLVSPAAAAGWQGIGWWLAQVGRLRAEFPDVAFDPVLDCGTAPGHAMEALRAGVATVMLEGPPETIRAVTEMATALGSRVVSAPPLPPGGRD